MAENFIVTISTIKEADGSHHQQAIVINIHAYTDLKHLRTNSSGVELCCTALATEIHPQKKAMIKYIIMRRELIMTLYYYKSA